MSSDILPPAVLQAMVGGLDLIGLVRTAETLKQSGQDTAAEALYANWERTNPEHPLLHAALFNHSVVLSDAGRLEEARQCLERAVLLAPSFAPAHINLGRVLERMGQVGPAVARWSVVLKELEVVDGTAIAHKTMALNQIARTLEALNQDEGAETMLLRSLDLDPRQREVIQHLIALRQRQCEWPVLAPTERADRDTLTTGQSPLSAAAITDDPLFQLALAAHYNQRDVGTPHGAMTAWPKALDHDGPLRVGYLSSDLREHAVGYLMADVLALHDRSKVEVFAYYCGVDSSDSLHERFKATADHWVRLDNDDDAAARRMAEDGLQILVDLNGYTREARLKVVARRPAPVIVNWLGFPGTMGSPYHHYLIADDWIIPEEMEGYYSERVVRLPCYQPNAQVRTVSPKRPTRADMGLPEDGTVFCCFNGTHKITPFTFDRWLTILAEVPGSVLWLLKPDDATTERLAARAEARGIGRERLVFAGKMANADHLARYPLADLFLDTTPYGAHTTASDALWMGVPVLTASGRSFASRVGGSLVRAAGLPDLVCATLDEYTDRAIALGRDRAATRALSETLLAHRDGCVLFDTPGLTRGLEDLYAAMWADHRDGRMPRPDLTNLDAYLEVALGTDPETLEVQTLQDYEGWWRANLARRHRFRPLGPDRRLVADPDTLTALLAEVDLSGF
jgi:predicted O-linked N-acetylglucosamine transferase (SPINDLY family)